MSLIQRLTTTRKSLTAKSFTPASDIDWTRIETLVHGPGAGNTWELDGDFNSAVFACLMTLCTAYTEPPPRVIRTKADSNITAVTDSPMVKLLNKPTPEGELSFDELMFWTGWAKHTDGNAYWIKVRSGDALTGNVIELWPVSPTLIKPFTELDERGRAKDWISYYKLQVTPGRFEPVPKENVIHFRLGLDPKDLRYGLSPLKRLIRQITSDGEADEYSNALLRNYAIPGLVVIPGQGEELDRETAERISTSMSEKFSGRNRGKTAVISRHGDIKQFGFTPKDLDISSMHRIPEERIAAVIGVPAILAGLGSGLDRGTYNNARELREFFTEQKLVPEWRSNAARLNASLTRDFHSNPAVTVEFDISNVRALQEDEGEKYERLNFGVQGIRQWISVNEARADVGLDPQEGGDDLEMVAPAPVLPPQFNQPPDENDEGDEKSLKQIKARSDSSRLKLVEARRVVRARVAGSMEKDVDAFFDDLANDLMRELSQEEPAISKHAVLAADGNGTAVKALSVRDWKRIVDQLFRQASDDLDTLIKGYVIEVSEQTWPFINLELQSTVQFSANDPAVTAALRGAGKHVRGIFETTRESLASYLQEAYADGRPIAEIGARVKELVAETYSGRGESIARTETATAQNTTTHGRYKAAGVKHVQVFDNGFDNSHEFCRQVAGKTVTVEWMQRNPLQHPRCVRGFGAVFDYDGAVFTEEQPWT